jgi:ABC-type Fe2+-enterobactin transport system substrate-binding protein
MTKRSSLLATISLLLFARIAAAQQYPVMDMIADKIIQKYQQSSCQQLWQRKGKPKTQKEKEAMQLMRDDPQMRTAFINKVAAPIANKMFECGMLP